MKSWIPFLTILFAILTGCNNVKHRSFTILGDGTPYSSYPEIMNGKVKSVSEKNYLAVPDGKSYKKGNPLSNTDRQKLGGWTIDFEAAFDRNAVLTLCSGLSETGQAIWKHEIIKENNKISRMSFYRNDKLSFYDKYTHGENGFPVEVKRFRAGNDTVMYTMAIKTNDLGYMTEIQVSNYSGIPTDRYLYTYDDQNRFKFLRMVDNKGQAGFVYEAKYNDKNKVSELIFKGKKGNIEQSNYFTYEYDKMGNWTKALVRNSKNQYIIEERKYTYFD